MIAEYLKKTMNDLPAHIVFMCGKQRRLEKLVRALGNVVLGLEILSCRQFSIFDFWALARMLLTQAHLCSWS